MPLEVHVPCPSLRPHLAVSLTTSISQHRIIHRQCLTLEYLSKGRGSFLTSALTYLGLLSTIARAGPISCLIGTSSLLSRARGATKLGAVGLCSLLPARVESLPARLNGLRGGSIVSQPLCCIFGCLIARISSSIFACKSSILLVMLVLLSTTGSVSRVGPFGQFPAPGSIPKGSAGGWRQGSPCRPPLRSHLIHLNLVSACSGCFASRQ